MKTKTKILEPKEITPDKLGSKLNDVETIFANIVRFNTYEFSMSKILLLGCIVFHACLSAQKI